MPRRRQFVALTLMTLLVFLVTLFARYSASPGDIVANLGIKLSPYIAPSCTVTLDSLDGLHPKYPIKYARREIIVRAQENASRPSLTKAKGKLFAGLQTIQDHKPSVKLNRCMEPIFLDVRVAQKKDDIAAHILFGISTTIERLKQSIPQLLRWLPGTGARLIVIVISSEQSASSEAVAADLQAMKELEDKMRQLGIMATLVNPLRLQDTFAEKYFSIIKVLATHIDLQTKWFATIDDDTFFPTVSGVVSMLNRYDPNEQHYVGGTSEEWWAVVHYGLMGFGGAGIFLSLPLGKILAENYQYCKEHSNSSAGDVRIRECIYQLTDTKLSYERALHQVDMHGDLSGLFEGGRLLLSIHHWKAGAVLEEGYNLPMMHLIADICQECFLQRWMFDDDTVLTNGYSIAQYPNGGLASADMEHLEETWDPIRNVDNTENHGADHALGLSRPGFVLNKEKIQYRLVHSIKTEDTVKQYYFHQGIEGAMDTWLELSWTHQLDPENGDIAISS